MESAEPRLPVLQENAEHASNCREIPVSVIPNDQDDLGQSTSGCQSEHSHCKVVSTTTQNTSATTGASANSKNTKDFHHKQRKPPDPDSGSYVDTTSSSSECLLPGHSKKESYNSCLYGSIQDSPTDDWDHSETAPATKSSIPIFPFILINSIVSLMSASGRFHAPLMDQYLYQRYADSLLGNASIKTTSHPCLNDSSSNDTDNVNKIQELTSNMLLNLDLSNYIPGIFACLLLGALSTTSMSRKAQLFIPLFGYTAKCVVIPIVVHWDLNLNWFYLGYVAEGVCGNASGIYLGAFLYTSDITSSDKKRTIGVTIVEGMKGIVGAGLNVVTGQLIEKTGFIIPAMLSAACPILSVGLVLLLPDRKPCILQGVSVPWWKRFLLPFGKNQYARVKKIVILAWAAFLLVEMSLTGWAKIQTLYLMNMPFCFDAITLGWFVFGRELGCYALGMIAVPVLYRCLPGMALGIFGTMSLISQYTMYALATTDAEIYSNAAIGVGQTLPISMIRGETSRLLGPEAQGPLFAGMAVLESVGYTLGAPALSIYRETLRIYKGVVCLVFVAMLLFATIVLIVYHVIWRRHVRELMFKETVVRPVGSINS